MNCVHVGHCAPVSMPLELTTCEVTKERGLKTADFLFVKNHGALPAFTLQTFSALKGIRELLLAGVSLALGREAVVRPRLLIGRFGRCWGDVRCRWSGYRPNRCCSRGCGLPIRWRMRNSPDVAVGIKSCADEEVLAVAA